MKQHFFINKEPAKQNGMKNSGIIRSLMMTASLFMTGVAMSQPPRVPLFVSPQVNPDNTVVFSLFAPSAKEVKLNAQFEKSNVPMTKDTSGVWSVKLGPVKPDMYPYHFIVDGSLFMKKCCFNADFFY